MRIARALRRWAVRAVLLFWAAAFCMDAAGIQALRASGAVPRDARTGLMQGAEPVRIERGRAGACLLLHGWMSTPADFADLPRAMDEAGWDVCAPLHPGHGTVPSDLEGVTADDLLQAAREHYASLRRSHGRVVLVGMSMGGTMATLLSVSQPPDGLVLVGPFYEVAYKPYYVLPPRWWYAMLSPFVRYVARPAGLVSVNRPEGRAGVIAYDAFPMDAADALFELRRRCVEQVDPASLTMPVLMVYSRADEASSPAAMEDFFGKLPVGRKRRAVFERSNHHIFRDYDREEAIQAVVLFLQDL